MIPRAFIDLATSDYGGEAELIPARGIELLNPLINRFDTDLGTMDNEGFTYFRGRSKRMIVTSGYNVYPAQLENIFDSCDLVSMSCVIGVPDPYKMQKVKVFVVPANGVEPSDATKEEILKYASKRIAKYAMPKDLEFRAELPKTLVGKVAYRKLEEEEAEKRKAAADAAAEKAAE